MDLVREVAAVLFVFALLGAFLILGRRGHWLTTGLRRTRSGPGRLQLLESLRLGPDAVIHLVRIDERTVVVSVHSGGCTLLTEEVSEASAEALRDDRH